MHAGVCAQVTHVPASTSVPRGMGLGMATAGTLGAHAAGESRVK
jgi:hypothetical protein